MMAFTLSIKIVEHSFHSFDKKSTVEHSLHSFDREGRAWLSLSCYRESRA